MPSPPTGPSEAPEAAGLSGAEVAELGGRLFAAFSDGRAVAPLTEERPDLTLDDAYRIQAAVIDRHRAQGRRVAGRKIGLTSPAIQEQVGVDQPDYGVVFDSHVFESGARLSLAGMKMIAPRLEGELAFVLKRNLRGPGVTRAEVVDASLSILPIFEVIDSRIADWKIRIADTVADNASGFGTVLGSLSSWSSSSDLDLARVTLALERDGVELHSGTGAAVLGHPAEAVAWLANTLATYDEELPAAQVILSGSFTAAVEALPGHYVARFGGGLGAVEVTIED